MGIDSDLLLVVGAFMALVVLPTIAKGFVDKSRPYIAWSMLVIGIVLFSFGVWLAPSSFSLARFPLAVVEVLARLFN